LVQDGIYGRIERVLAVQDNYLHASPAASVPSIAFV
jgi:hypothetical protein